MAKWEVLGEKYRATPGIFLVVVNDANAHWMLAAVDVMRFTITAYNSMQPKAKVGPQLILLTACFSC